MKTEEIINKVDEMRINIIKQRIEWDELKDEINNIKPPDNYGIEAIDRSFVDMFASIDYLKFLLKK